MASSGQRPISQQDLQHWNQSNRPKKASRQETAPPIASSSRGSGSGRINTPSSLPRQQAPSNNDNTVGQLRGPVGVGESGDERLVNLKIYNSTNIHTSSSANVPPGPTATVSLSNKGMVSYPDLAAAMGDSIEPDPDLKHPRPVLTLPAEVKQEPEHDPISQRTDWCYHLATPFLILLVCLICLIWILFAPGRPPAITPEQLKQPEQPEGSPPPLGPPRDLLLLQTPPLAIFDDPLDPYLAFMSQSCVCLDALAVQTSDLGLCASADASSARARDYQAQAVAAFARVARDYLLLVRLERDLLQAQDRERDGEYITKQRGRLGALLGGMQGHVKALCDVGQAMTELFTDASEDILERRRAALAGREKAGRGSVADDLEALYQGVQEVAEARAEEVKRWTRWRCTRLERRLMYMLALLEGLEERTEGPEEVRELTQFVGEAISYLDPLGRPVDGDL